MKAYLIDPAAMTFSAIDLPYDNSAQDWRNIPAALGCELFSTLRMNAHGDSLFFDDEGKLGDLNEQHFFIFRAMRGDFLIAGKGLILGMDDEGESVAPCASEPALRAQIVFIPPALQGRARYEAEKELARGPIVESFDTIEELQARLGK